MHWRFRRAINKLQQARRQWTHPRAAAWERLCREAPERPVIARLAGGLRVRVYPHDVIGRDIYVSGMFEPAECRFVARFLRPNMVFFDIGANLGQYALIAAQRVGPTGQVHAFEPSGRMFGELTYNVGLNGFGDICTLNRAAVFDRVGEAALSKYNAGAEVYGSLGKHRRPEGEIIGEERVPTVTLDEYVAQQQLRRVHLIKLDIEGAELAALRGGQQLLARPDGPAVLLELCDVNAAGFDYEAGQTWDLLEAFGYRLHAFDAAGRLTGPAQRPTAFPRALNLVALKPDALP